MEISWQLFPFSLGLLPEYVIDVPELHFEIERYLFSWFNYSNIILSLDSELLTQRKQNNHTFNRKLGTIILL